MYNPYYLDADVNTQAKYQIHGQLDNRGQGVSVDIKDDKVSGSKTYDLKKTLTSRAPVQ